LAHGTEDFNVVDSISDDGLKVLTMSNLEAKQLRYSSDLYRVLPVRKYFTARSPIVKASSKELLKITRQQQIKTQIFIKQEGTDKPLEGVDVVAIADVSTNAGVKRKTGAAGQATITLPNTVDRVRLFLYPPAGYWGKYIDSHQLSDREVIYLKPIDPSYADFLKQDYGKPKENVGQGVRVAVIDTGVDRNHRELNLKIAKNCVFDESETDLDPSDGHGTHVAGIIAAKNYGIAPAVELCSYKVFPHQGGATNVDIARAIDMAVRDRCDLINLSLGGGKQDEALSEAIGYAYAQGVVCIAAAGNAQRQPVAYPAWYKRAIAVSAIGKVGTFPDDAIEIYDIDDPRSTLDRDVFFARFSNVGREIDVCAPGVGIISTWLNNEIAALSGTSMACPVVTAIGAALLSGKSVLARSRDASRSTEIIQIIQNACRSVGLLQEYEGIGQPSF
jgi:subtilisin